MASSEYTAKYIAEFKFMPNTKIKMREDPWYQEFIGSGDELVAAGIVEAWYLPGAPNMNKTTVTRHAGDFVPQGCSSTPNDETSIQIIRTGNGRFKVRRGLAESERIRRFKIWRVEHPEFWAPDLAAKVAMENVRSDNRHGAKVIPIHSSHGRAANRLAGEPALSRNAKIIPLRTGQAKEIIETLEGLIEEAKRGKIDGLVYIKSAPNEVPEIARTGRYVPPAQVIRAMNSELKYAYECSAENPDEDDS